MRTVRFINKEIVSYVKQERSEVSLDKSTLPDLKLIAAAEDIASVESIKVKHQRPAPPSKKSKNTTDFPPQLLKLILLVAFSSPRGDDYRARLKQLSTSTQEKINTVVEEVGRSYVVACIADVHGMQVQRANSNDAQSDTMSRKESTPGQVTPASEEDYQRQLLYYEQRVVKATQANKEIREENDELSRERQELKATVGKLQKEIVSGAESCGACGS